MTAKKQLLLAGAALAAALGSSAAHAQSLSGTLAQASNAQSNFARDRNISVLQRPHPGYEASGLPAGAFRVWPKVTATVDYNDNLFATSGDKVSDAIFHITPEVDVTSDWSRHMLQAYARGTFNQFAQNSDQNTNDFSVGANGRLDVLRTTAVNVGADFSRYTEPRTSAASEGNRFPIQYDQSSAYVSAFKEFNRLRLSGRFNFAHYDYIDRAGNFPQSDRDRDVMVLTGRADYAVSPDTALFVEVTGNDRDYRLSSSPLVSGFPIFPNFINRDSSGVQALVGANFELSALVRGEIGVGYMKQTYDDPTLKDVSGTGARAQVEWFPDQLTTVTFTGSRSVEDAALPGASSYIASNIGLRADHELLRNLILSANGGYSKNDYRGIDRNDTIYTAGLSANYLMNRAVGISVGYNYYKQDSSGADTSSRFANFVINRVGVTLTVQD